MKITKSQLKQLIKEELESTLDEGFMDSLTGMLGFGGTGGSDSAILDKAIAATPKFNFEEFKAMIHTRYRDGNPDKLIEDLVSVAKVLDVQRSTGQSMALYKGILKLKRGDRSFIDELISKHKRALQK
jgi:hypothetical protein